MRCALVLYLAATIFVIVYTVPELCEIDYDYGDIVAYCGIVDVEYRFDFIPPFSKIITFIDLEGQPLKKLPYNAFRNLSFQNSISTILVDHCHISHVNAGALMNLHNLNLIDLSYNDITQIDSKLFSHTKQIVHIYLEFNKIEFLPRELFQNLTLLRQVFLNDNRIRQVESFSFRNTPSLWDINLSNNMIDFMSILFKDKFDNFEYLSLGGNPWKCDCELGPLYELLIRTDYLNQLELVCKTPPKLHGQEWMDISRDEFVCSSDDTISTQDSVITTTGTEPMTTTEQDDIEPVVVSNRTRYQLVDTGTPQPPSDPNWIQYTLLVLGLMCLAVLIIGVVFVVRYTLAKSNMRLRVRLPTVIKRRSFRTNARQMNASIPMRVIQCDSKSNTSDVDEEQINLVK